MLLFLYSLASASVGRRGRGDGRRQRRRRERRLQLRLRHQHLLTSATRRQLLFSRSNFQIHSCFMFLFCICRRSSPVQSCVSTSSTSVRAAATSNCVRSCSNSSKTHPSRSDSSSTNASSVCHRKSPLVPSNVSCKPRKYSKSTK